MCSAHSAGGRGLALAEWATKTPAEDATARLSRQEREVYLLVGEGEGTYEIAAALKISTRTVEAYYTRILTKLRLQGMYELRHHAVAHVRTLPK